MSDDSQEKKPGQPAENEAEPAPEKKGKGKGKTPAKEKAKAGKGKEAAPGKEKEKAAEKPKLKPIPSRMKKFYLEQCLPALLKEFNYRNPMQAPRMTKITVNLGLGEASQNIKLLDLASEELKAISGQKPVITRARRSIAGFKLRAGAPIGCMVTLRGDRMYDFFDRLVNVALPRVRDFRGVSPHSFDGRGNFSLGIREQIIFPEISYDKVERIQGMNITITTTARTDEEARALLKLMGMPFREN